MLTHKDRFLALLKEFGVEPVIGDDGSREGWEFAPSDVVLYAGHGGVGGYTGSACVFTFNEDGTLRGVGVLE